MEGDQLTAPPPPAFAERIRQVTSQTVSVALGLALLCLGAGLAHGLPADGLVVSLRALPGALARLDAAALASAGVLLLVAAPITRVVGLLVGFWHDRDRAAFAAALVTLAMLALTFLGVRAE